MSIARAAACAAILALVSSACSMTKGDGALSGKGQSPAGRTAVSPAGSGGSKLVVYLDGGPVAPHAPFYLAKRDGLYDKAGLDVVLRHAREGSKPQRFLSTRGSGEAVRAVASGSGAVAVAAGETVIEAVDDGMKVRFFATLLHRSPDGLQIPDPGRVKDLAGKRVDAPGVLPWRSVIPTLLARNDAPNARTVKIAPPDLVPALEANRVAGIAGYPHVYAPRLDKAGIEYRTHRLVDLGLRLPGRGFVARKRTIEDRAADLRKLVRVTARAFALTKEKPKRAARIMHERFPNLDEGALLEHLRAVVRLIETDRGTDPIIPAWRKTEKVLKRGGRIEEIRGPRAYVSE